MSSIDTSFLNPITQKFLSLFPPDIDYSKLTIQQVRNASEVPLSDDIKRPNVTIEKLELPSQVDGHTIHIDVFRPKSAAIDEALPVVVYLPGGGWSVAAQGAHPFLATKLAGETNCAVFLVHYSLSPEVKYPVALEECYDVISYVTSTESAKKLRVDPTRVALGGDSAGGNLTIAVTLLAKQRDKLENSIKYQVLYYPATDDTMSSGSYQKFGVGYYLTRSFMEFFYSNYKPEVPDNSILFTPARATIKDVEGLPPALLVTAEADVLRDEGEKYGRKLMSAGVPITSVRINGVIHGFMSLTLLHSQETLNVINLTTSALRTVFGLEG